MLRRSRTRGTPWRGETLYFVRPDTSTPSIERNDRFDDHPVHGRRGEPMPQGPTRDREPSHVVSPIILHLGCRSKDSIASL